MKSTPVVEAVQARAAQISAWRYDSGDRRDLRLDLLRGFAAFAMIADHIGGPSWFWPVTGANSFVVSAAEAFVFISGLVLGIVYARIIVKQGLGAVVRKLSLRTVKLYALTVVLSCGFAFSGALFGLSWAPELGAGGWTAWVIEIATLQRTLYLADIPLMYTLLLALAVPALWVMGRGYSAPVLAASWLLWLSWQVQPTSSALFWEIEDNVFNIPAWQVLFVTGIGIGYHRRQIEAWCSRLPRRAQAMLVGLVLALAAAAYAAQIIGLDTMRGNASLFELVFDKGDVPFGRLIGFALFFAAAYALTTIAWKPLKAATGWLLLPLGQNSLTAYNLHLGAVVIVSLLTLTGSVNYASGLASTVLQLAAVVAVWVAVRYTPDLASVRLDAVLPLGVRSAAFQGKAQAQPAAA